MSEQNEKKDDRHERLAEIQAFNTTLLSLRLNGAAIIALGPGFHVDREKFLDVAGMCYDATAEMMAEGKRDYLQNILSAKAEEPKSP